jgi:hypothetical protein
MFHGPKRRKLWQGQDEELELSIKYWVSDFIALWAKLAPPQLQSWIMDYQEVKEKQKQHITAT